MEGAGFDSEMEEEDIDEELALPDVLQHIGYADKKELLRFKRAHNEIEWEEEVLRRSDLLARRIDMERLKKMAGGTTNSAPAEASTGTKRKRVAKRTTVADSDEASDGSEYSQKQSKRRNAVEKDKDSDSAADDFDLLDDDEPEAKDDDDDDAFDQLFDSEEEEEINRRGKHVASDNEEVGTSNKGKKLGTSKRIKSGNSQIRRSTRKSKTAAASSDEEDDDEYGYSEFQRRGKKSPTKPAQSRDDDSSDESRDVRDKSRGSIESDDEEEGPDAELADYADYLRLQARRSLIVQKMNEPYFAQMLVGMFVRVLVGGTGANQNQETAGQADANVYRMAEIASVEMNGRKYMVPDLPEPVSIRLTYSFLGKEMSGQKITFISNSRIALNECKYFIDNMQRINNKRPLTKKQFQRRREKLKAFTEKHTYTESEIKEMVSRRLGMDKSIVTDYSTAVESLRRKLTAAQQDKDYDTMEAVQKTLEKLQTEFKAQKAAHDKAVRGQLAVNQRMRAGNVQRDIAAGMKKRQADKEAAARMRDSGNQVEADPFARRETRPKILWNSNKRNQTQSQDTSLPSADAVNNSAKDPTASAIIDKDLGNSTAAGVSWQVVDDVSLDEIRKRVRQRLGQDPYAAAQIPARNRYLARVCAKLPPVNSAERAELRRKIGPNVKTLFEVLDALAIEQQEEGVAMEVQ